MKSIMPENQWNMADSGEEGSADPCKSQEVSRSIIKWKLDGLIFQQYLEGDDSREAEELTPLLSSTAAPEEDEAFGMDYSSLSTSQFEQVSYIL